EIFHSIQGESGHMGLPCVFVRLTYCNIRCSYCDTAYAFHEGKETSLDEIVQTVDGFGCKLIEITGGEPLYQENVHPLMSRLCDTCFRSVARFSCRLFSESWNRLLSQNGSSRISSKCAFSCRCTNISGARKRGECNMPVAIILVSGGMDSCVTAAIAGRAYEM